MRFDVAVVGAGPAGSTLAALLARRGASVALINREEFPRDKLCGEFLSYDALPILERLGITLDTPLIRRCRIVSRHRTYEFEFPRPARGVSRQRLDDLLFRTAVASGAQPLAGWTAAGLDPVTLEREGERRTIDARLVVGAWGRWGRFDVQLGRRFVRDHAHRHFGFKRHYRGGQAPSPVRTGEAPVLHTVDNDTIELYSFRGGYLGVSPVENGITNICGLVRASRIANLKGGWESFVATIRTEEPHLDAMYARHQPAQDGFLSCEPVIFRARSAVERGIVMIGDAAGIIDPLTGNGMAMAIQSGVLAAPYILRMLAGGDADSYAAAHAELFDARIRWSRRVAAVLSSPALLDAGLYAVRTARAGEFLLGRTRAAAGAVERLADQSFC